MLSTLSKTTDTLSKKDAIKSSGSISAPRLLAIDLFSKKGVTCLASERKKERKVYIEDLRKPLEIKAKENVDIVVGNFNH